MMAVWGRNMLSKKKGEYTDKFSRLHCDRSSVIVCMDFYFYTLDRFTFENLDSVEAMFPVMELKLCENKY
jgi:hypothetical protein